MNRRLGVATAVSLVLLSAGCSAEGTSETAVATPESVVTDFGTPADAVIHRQAWRGVSAEIPSESNPGTYEIVVGAEEREGVVTASLRVPMPGSTITYNNAVIMVAMSDAENPATLEISDELDSAHLDATVQVQWCMTPAGETITAGCPIGQNINVSANWTSSNPLETMAGDYDLEASVSGRLGTAVVSIDGNPAIDASYGEIVEGYADIATDQ